MPDKKTPPTAVEEDNSLADLLKAVDTFHEAIYASNKLLKTHVLKHSLAIDKIYLILGVSFLLNIAVTGVLMVKGIL